MQTKESLLQKDAVIKIQSAFRCMTCRRSFISRRLAAIDIQRFIRGQATRRRLLGNNSSAKGFLYLNIFGINPTCIEYALMQELSVL